MKKSLLFFLFFLVFAMLFPLALAEQHLPANILKIQEYNEQQSQQFATLSYFVAFLAGILALLSPCVLPLVPAYFAVTFKENKRKMLTALSTFTLGFLLVFLALGFFAGFLGQQSFLVVQGRWLTFFAGFFLIGMGLLTFFGKGFSSLITPKFRGKTFVDEFLSGMAFAAGWTACVGPIITGILGIAAYLHDYGKAVLLLFFYGLGNFLPLLLLVYFFGRIPFLQKLQRAKLRLFGWEIHWTSFLSGSIFLLLGLLIFFSGGTGIINKYDPFGTKQYFYTFQRLLLGWSWAKPVAILIFFAFVAGLGYLFWQQKKQK